MVHRLFIAVFSLAVLAPAAFAADSTPADKSLVMSKIDTDNDGTVSLQEAQKTAEAKFASLDTDNEGTLDASELTGIVGKGGISKGDPDKDGTLDKAEYLAMVEKMFKAADKDSDGTLSPKELSTERGRAVIALLSY